MKLNYAPQVGLRRRRPDHRRERLAFWGGVAIVVAFELILMAKTWPAYDPDQGLHWPWSEASAPLEGDNGPGDAASTLPARTD